MAEAYSGLVGAYGYALRRSESWLFRSYVLASAIVGVYFALLLLLGLISWIASPIAFGERAFLGVIALFVLVPLSAPVLVTARRHRRGTDDPTADQWLAVGGFAFVISIGLALFISDPESHTGAGVVGAVVVWLDALPNIYGLAPPILTTVLLAGLVGLTGPDES